MRFQRAWKQAAGIALIAVCLCGSIGHTLTVARAAGPDASGAPRSAVLDGVKMEQSWRWLEAIDHYESALKQWPDDENLKLGLRRSRIHFSIERRYVDNSFENTLLNMGQYEAMRILADVMARVRVSYVDRVSVTSFIAHGTESLYLALANPKFVEKHLATADQSNIERLRNLLRDNYWNKRLSDQYQAEQTVESVCEAARRYVGLKSSAVILEYICGGCNSLDDYSNFLTPDRLADLNGSIEGEFVGLGIEMKAVDGEGMLLVNVLADSPAERGGLKAGEYVIGIDGVDCRNMTTDEAAKLLRGPSGSVVLLNIRNAELEQSRRGRFVRRAVQVKSIPIVRMLDRAEGIGYIQMTGFQRSSADELDAAIRMLRAEGMQKLIWDLRGNPGGLLTAAVDVLDRFIDNGVLVSTRGRSSNQNDVYSATSFGTHRFPLLLLVDSDSASASEIVAGAIRDHKRGRIVGTKTYGKWSVQTILPITGSSGLRLTTAKFFSPNGLNHSKVGVEPDVKVDIDEEFASFYRGPTRFEPDRDPVLKKGLEILRQSFAQR